MTGDPDIVVPSGTRRRATLAVVDHRPLDGDGLVGSHTIGNGEAADMQIGQRCFLQGHDVAGAADALIPCHYLPVEVRAMIVCKRRNIVSANTRRGKATKCRRCGLAISCLPEVEVIGCSHRHRCPCEIERLCVELCVVLGHHRGEFIQRGEQRLVTIGGEIHRDGIEADAAAIAQGTHVYGICAVE